MAARHRGSGAGISGLALAQRPRLDRAPALKAITEHLTAALAGRLTHLTTREADVKAEEVGQHDPSDYLASLDGQGVVALIECAAHTGVGAGVVRIQAQLLHPLLDLALGGRRGSDVATLAARPFTAIERRVTERLIGQVLGDLRTAFAAFAPIQFRLDRLEAKNRPSRLSPSNSAVLLIRLKVDLQSCAGCIDVVLPAVAVDAAQATSRPAAARTGKGGTWASQLLGELCEVDVELEAVLHERTVDLSLASELKVGQTISLGVRPDAAIAVRCGRVGVVMAAVACREEQLVLSVESCTIDNGSST
jgi:flagellar motor switch protein FliM